MILIFKRMLEFVSAKFHQAKCNGSRVIVFKFLTMLKPILPSLLRTVIINMTVYVGIVMITVFSYLCRAAASRQSTSL